MLPGCKEATEGWVSTVHTHPCVKGLTSGCVLNRLCFNASIACLSKLHKSSLSYISTRRHLGQQCEVKPTPHIKPLILSSGLTIDKLTGQTRPPLKNKSLISRQPCDLQDFGKKKNNTEKDSSSWVPQTLQSTLGSRAMPFW